MAKNSEPGEGGSGPEPWWALIGTGENAGQETVTQARTAAAAVAQISGPWTAYGPFATQNQAGDFSPGVKTKTRKSGKPSSGGGGEPAPAASWYVIAVQVVSSKVPLTDYEAAQKPFPAGATEISGPYATRAAALAGANTQKNKAVSAPNVPNPISSITEAGHWIARFVAAVTDVHLWISLGWLFLGFSLLVTGLLGWFGQTGAGKQLAGSFEEVGGIVASAV